MGLAGLAVLLLIIALFVPKEYIVTRQITINKPKSEVFNYIRHLKNQDYYSKWVMTDPHMKKSYRGTDGTTGFVYAWDGNKKAGKGEQEIKNLIEGEKLEVEVRFIKPFAGTALTPMITEALSVNQTRVTWGMRGSNPYPFNLTNLFIGKLLGTDLETSLQSLKKVLE